MITLCGRTFITQDIKTLKNLAKQDEILIFTYIEVYLNPKGHKSRDLVKPCLGENCNTFL